jgi:phospholipid transport system transporter-binding protein
MADLSLPPRLTLAEASAVARDLTAKATSASGAPMVFDASGIQAFDSSAFSVMLEVMRHVQGQQVSVRGAPASMVDLARLYGVDDLLVFEG